MKPLSILGLAAVLLAGCQAPPAPALHTTRQAVEECGTARTSTPDFRLVDLNDTSPTFGQEVSLSEFDDRVVLLYWATAT